MSDRNISGIPLVQEAVTEGIHALSRFAKGIVGQELSERDIKMCKEIMFKLERAEAVLYGKPVPPPPGGYTR